MKCKKCGLEMYAIEDRFGITVGFECPEHPYPPVQPTPDDAIYTEEEPEPCDIFGHDWIKDSFDQDICLRCGAMHYEEKGP